MIVRCPSCKTTYKVADELVNRYAAGVPLFPVQAYLRARVSGAIGTVHG